MLEYEFEIGAEVSQIIWVHTQISCLSTYSDIWVLYSTMFGGARKLVFQGTMYLDRGEKYG